MTRRRAAALQIFRFLFFIGFCYLQGKNSRYIQTFKKLGSSGYPAGLLRSPVLH